MYERQHTAKRTPKQIAEQEARYRAAIMMRGMNRKEALALFTLLNGTNPSWQRVAGILRWTRG